MVQPIDLSFLLEFVRSFILLLFDAVRLLILNLTPFQFRTKKSVANEVVLITGGGSGFGRLLAIKFSQLGARVVIWDVDEAGSLETTEIAKEQGGRIFSYIIDVSDQDGVYRMAKRVSNEVGPVSILINNAGIAHCEPFLETSDALLKKVMDVNAMAHFWTVKAFLPDMVKRNHGHVVAVSSMAGIIAPPRGSAYSASKHAVIGLMDSISFDLIDAGATGVKTTVVCPFFSPTPLFSCKYDGYLPMLEPEEVVKQIVQGVLTDKEMIVIPKISLAILPFKIMSTHKAIYRLSLLLIGDSLAKTVRIKSVFKEQET